MTQLDGRCLLGANAEKRRLHCEILRSSSVPSGRAGSPLCPFDTPIAAEYSMDAPSSATEAVLKPSDPIGGDMREVKGIDFNSYAGRDVTVAEMINGMADMGFQASSVAEAVRIIENMVSCLLWLLRYAPLSPIENMARRRRCQNDYIPWIHVKLGVVGFA